MSRPCPDNNDFQESFAANPITGSRATRPRSDYLADKVIRALRPRHVLDLCSGIAFFVEALRERGVNAWGTDVLAFALYCATNGTKLSCRPPWPIDNLPLRSFDLITCMEVLEHVAPEFLLHVVMRMATLTDTILFSSSPSAFGDRTHVSTKPIEGWLNLFGYYGYSFDPLFDASFVASHAILFRRQASCSHLTVSYDESRYRGPHCPSQHSHIKRALFVSGCLGDPYRYRCEHQGEELGLLGWDVQYANAGAMLDPAVAASYDLLVLHRLQHSAGIDSILNRVRSNHVPVLFDTDDLVFSENAVNYVPAFRNCPPQVQKSYVVGVRNMATTLQLCTGAIVSTEALQCAVRRTAPRVRAWVNRNAVSNIMVAQASALLNARKRIDSEVVRLGYFSGTFTHAADFSVCCDALVNILRCYRHVQLILAGRIKIPKLLLPFSDRVRLLPFVPWRQLPGLMLDANINLAPLEAHSPFADCKSELKYLEAGLLGIPTVASPVGGYVKAIANGENGYLCDGTPEWVAVLRTLIEHPTLRANIGESARQNVLAEHVTAVRRRSLEAIINEVVADT